MHPYRDGPDPGGGALTRRLDQLRSTLDRLDARLRSAVAEAVGESLGGYVRDAVLQALAWLSGGSPEPEPSQFHLEPGLARRSALSGGRPYPDPAQSPSRPWGDPGRRDEDDAWLGPGERAWGPEEDDGDDGPGREEEPTPQADGPTRLALTASAGLQAAAWWLGCRPGRRGPLTALAVALVVGCVACTAPGLTAALFRLFGSASQLGLLGGMAGQGGALSSAFSSA